MKVLLWDLNPQEILLQRIVIPILRSNFYLHHSSVCAMLDSNQQRNGFKPFASTYCANGTKRGNKRNE